MARELRRLLISPERLAAAADGPLQLTDEESRYLERVLRFRPGDRFAVVDGAGSLWSACLGDDGRAVLGPSSATPLQRQASPQPPLVLAAAVVRRDFEVVVRMAVELGVDSLIPLLCERTAVQGQLRPDRWRSIAAEAAEQCERLLEPSGALSLWASARGGRRSDLNAVLDAIGLEGEPLPSVIRLACGPEGGWSEAEEQQALGRGWRPIGLGPRILRSSSAAVAGLSALSAWRARRCGC
jgi:16S rRNA (uracil1498-N3)-methyltransferase